MNALGFGVFGRPIGHQYVSNGLFKQLGIEGDTYLVLPNNTELKKGESLAIISRQKIETNKKPIEVIKVYLFSYAESFNSRPGGFVGSAYVFYKEPTPTLLYKAVKHIHSKALSALDSQGKFKAITLGLTERDLLNPESNNLLTDRVLFFPKKPLKRQFISVLTDGPLIDHLMSVVQGFIYNPNFKQFESIYVSQSKDLLMRCSSNNQSKFYRIPHLLDYSGLFNEKNNKLNYVKNEIQKKISNFKELEKAETTKLNNCENELKELEKKKNQFNQDIKTLESEINSKTKTKESLTSEIDNLKIKEKQEREKKTKIENANLNQIKSILNTREAYKYKQSLIINSVEYRELKEKNKVLQEENDKYKKRGTPLSQKIMILTGVLLLFLTVGFILGHYKVPQKGWNSLFSKVQTNNIETQSDTDFNVSTASIKMPKQIILKEFLQLEKSKQDHHKSLIDEVLAKLEVEKPESSKFDLTDFFDREWNFAEIIDYDVSDIGAGLTRYYKILNLYKTYNKPTDFFEKYLIPLEGNQKNIEEYDFKTNERNEIFKQYIELPNNVYENLGLKELLSDIENIEKDYPLVYMHFRWVIFEISHRKEDYDLSYTNKTQHFIPIINN